VSCRHQEAGQLWHQLLQQLLQPGHGGTGCSSSQGSTTTLLPHTWQSGKPEKACCEPRRCLNPWWVRKLFFIVDSYKRFHPMGSTYFCLSTSRLQLFFSRTQAGLLNIRLYKLMSTLLYKKS
jgi:hypothetical protein